VEFALLSSSTVFSKTTNRINHLITSFSYEKSTLWPRKPSKRLGGIPGIPLYKPSTILLLYLKYGAQLTP